MNHFRSYHQMYYRRFYDNPAPFLLSFFILFSMAALALGFIAFAVVTLFMFVYFILSNLFTIIASVTLVFLICLAVAFVKYRYFKD